MSAHGENILQLNISTCCFGGFLHLFCSVWDILDTIFGIFFFSFIWLSSKSFPPWENAFLSPVEFRNEKQSHVVAILFCRALMVVTAERDSTLISNVFSTEWISVSLVTCDTFLSLNAAGAETRTICRKLFVSKGLDFRVNRWCCHYGGGGMPLWNLYSNICCEEKKCWG